jgi:hypothetical protein
VLEVCGKAGQPHVTWYGSTLFVMKGEESRQFAGCFWSMVGVLKVGFDNPTVFGLEAREDNFRIGATRIQLRAVFRVKLAAW